MPTQPNAEPEFQLGDALVSQTERTGFDAKGSDIDPDSTECVAKSSKDVETGNTRFWIKTHKTGINAGHYFNPQSMYTKPSLSGRGQSGLDAYAWVPARKEAFESYVQFLITGNIVCLRKAERS